jgi:YggT family protein
VQNWQQCRLRFAQQPVSSLAWRGQRDAEDSGLQPPFFFWWEPSYSAPGLSPSDKPRSKLRQRLRRCSKFKLGHYLILRLFWRSSPRYNPLMLNPIAALLIEVLEIYKWVVFAAVIVSWLTAFNVINQYNNFVRGLLRFLYALTEPVFRPIRKIIPPIGGFDLSPIVVFVIIWFLQYTIQYVSYRSGL